MFVKADLTGKSEAERAAYYEANAEHFDQIFDGERVTFDFDPDRTLTNCDDVLMTLREAKAYDAKKAWSEKHPSAHILGFPA
jgi:hypothetical protein